MITQVLERNPQGVPFIVVVRGFESATGVVCAHHVSEEQVEYWEPLYGLRPGGDFLDEGARVSLPSCFSLNGAAILALEGAK